VEIPNGLAFSRLPRTASRPQKCQRVSYVGAAAQAVYYESLFWYELIKLRLVVRKVCAPDRLARPEQSNTLGARVLTRALRLLELRLHGVRVRVDV
jgi:hypothetical protein